MCCFGKDEDLVKKTGAAASQIFMAPDSLFSADIQQQQICDWFGEGTYYHTILGPRKQCTTRNLAVYKRRSQSAG